MNLNLSKGILNLKRSDLNLKACLKGGMSFRWNLTKETELYTEFIGIIKNKIFNFKQFKNTIEYSVYHCEKNLNEPDLLDEINDYFRLDENLTLLYQDWSEKDAKFKSRVETYSDILCGIRVLRLDPVENLFSFICSSNNNIKRITQMVNNMCLHFGQLIGKLEDKEYYSFPSIDRLAESDVESKLRELNFGYRAKFIHKAAVYIKANYSDDKWLFSLREKPYTEVHQELVKIPGIGKKVADCIALMSLDKLEAIPVDTHVLSLAKNLYNFVPNELKNKTSNSSLSDKNYKLISDSFRSLWGKYAGWAQTIMFIDDLSDFQKLKRNLSQDSITTSSKNKKTKN